MPRPNQHSLERSINSMQVGLVLERVAQEKREAPLRLDETDQVFQIPVEGVAEGSFDVWSTVDITFPYIFTGSSERAVPLATPNFTWGFELTTARGTLATPPPVVVNCCVLSWKREEYDPTVTEYANIAGARLGLAAFVPGFDSVADDPVRFKGLLHLTFGGYAAPAGMDQIEE